MNELSKQVNTQDGPLNILSSISLEIKDGEVVAIVGASGSGKSTLLGLMAGLDVPSKGEIHMVGESVSSMDEESRARIRGEQVGFVFQSFQLLPSLTALENVMLPVELKGLGQANDRARSWLDKVGLTPRADFYARQLSGGEQQRVAIARAFAAEPRILFADEPTGNLDTATGATIIELLFGLNKENGTTLVMVTHDLGLAAQCDRRVHLEGGRVTSID